MKFVNRSKEKKELPQLLGDDSNIIVIYGKEGVGKSQLIFETLKMSDNPQTLIVVEGAKLSKASTEYYHISLLLEQLAKIDKNFIYFVKSFFSTIGWVVRKLIKYKTCEIIDIEYTPIKQKIHKIYRYLYLAKPRFCIFFKNAENIEMESMDVLYKISADLENVKFIFEYTICQKDIVKMKKEIKNKVDKVKFYNVDMIDFNEIKSLFDNDKISDDQWTMIEKYYIVHEGDLDCLFDEFDEYLIDHIEKNEYDDFNIQTKILFQIINLSPKKLNLNNILTLYDFNEEHHFPDILDSNSIRKLIKDDVLRNDNGLYIANEAFQKKISTQQVPIEKIIAYDMLTIYFSNINDYESLFVLYCQFNVSNIINILPEMRLRVMNKKYPERIVEELENLLKKIDDQDLNELKKRIILFAVELCVFIDDFERGKFYLDKIYDAENKAHLIAKAALVSIQQKPFKELVVEIDQLRKNTPIKSRTEFVLQLYKLKLYMEHADSESTRKLINLLLSVKEYENYPEFCYLLRNKAEISDLETANNLYEECLSISSEIKDPTYVSSINLALSMNFAHMGDLKKAMKYHQRAAKYLNRGVREYYILNNFAVIKMLAGKFDKNVLEDLQMALLLNNNQYDKIIILCNLLVCCLKMHLDGQVEQFVSELLSIPMNDFKYEELQHLYFQNLLFYYQLQSDQNKIEEYTFKIKKLMNSIGEKSYTYQLASAQLNKEKVNGLYYSQFDFRVDFLGYWDYNIPLDDFL